MKKSLSLPNHKSWSTNNGTALLAVETGVNPNLQNPHIHIRKPQSSFGAAVELGSTPGSTCAIFRVAPYETIQVTRWDSGTPRQESYDVLPDFTLRIHDQLEAGEETISGRIGQPRNHLSESLTVAEVDLESLFEREWPEWLQAILEAQLRHWRKHHLEHYFHYSPAEMSVDDLWRCVRSTPSQALRRFGAKLSRTQREICFREAPRAAAAYALASLGTTARRRAIEEYPEDVLRNASLHLTAAELIALATKCPSVVFKCYRCMPGKQRARALSVALNQRRGYFPDQVALPKERLLGSLTEFPTEWLVGAGGNFENVLSVWADRLGWILTGKEMMEIQQRLPSSYQVDFTKAIAQRI